MRIGFDLRMIGGGSGIGRYITELSHEILKQDKANQYVLFFRSADKSTDYEQYGQKIVIADIPHYSFAEQWQFPRILRKEELDLVHFPHFNIPILYREKFIVTIHDLTHTLIPGKKKSRFFYRLAYHIVFWNAIRSAVKIIAVSEATKKAILDYYHVDGEKIKVIYEGSSKVYFMIDKEAVFKEVSSRFSITNPYILYVGAWRRYKNLPMLAKIFDRLVDAGLDFELVLVGKEDPFYPEINEQVYSIKYKERIKALGRISDEDLNLVYNAATLFVLPSLMEGFGLTILEAAACGIPIACSDIPSLREVAAQAAEYFDPNNIDNMTDVLKSLLSKPQRMEELANLALSRSKYFNWEKAAKETIEVYS